MQEILHSLPSYPIALPNIPNYELLLNTLLALLHSGSYHLSPNTIITVLPFNPYNAPSRSDSRLDKRSGTTEGRARSLPGLQSLQSTIASTLSALSPNNQSVGRSSPNIKSPSLNRLLGTNSTHATHINDLGSINHTRHSSITNKPITKAVPMLYLYEYVSLLASTHPNLLLILKQWSFKYPKHIKILAFLKVCVYPVNLLDFYIELIYDLLERGEIGILRKLLSNLIVSDVEVEVAEWSRVIESVIAKTKSDILLVAACLRLVKRSYFAKNWRQVYESLKRRGDLEEMRPLIFIYLFKCDISVKDVDISLIYDDSVILYYFWNLRLDFINKTLMKVLRNGVTDDRLCTIVKSVEFILRDVREAVGTNGFDFKLILKVPLDPLDKGNVIDGSGRIGGGLDDVLARIRSVVLSRRVEYVEDTKRQLRRASVMLEALDSYSGLAKSVDLAGLVDLVKALVRASKWLNIKWISFNDLWMFHLRDDVDIKEMSWWPLNDSELLKVQSLVSPPPKAIATDIESKEEIESQGEGEQTEIIEQLIALLLSPDADPEKLLSDLLPYLILVKGSKCKLEVELLLKVTKKYWIDYREEIELVWDTYLDMSLKRLTYVYNRVEAKENCCKVVRKACMKFNLINLHIEKRSRADLIEAFDLAYPQML